MKSHLSALRSLSSLLAACGAVSSTGCAAVPAEDLAASTSQAQSVAVGAFPPGETFGLSAATRADATSKMLALFERHGATVGTPAVSGNTFGGFVHPWPNATCLTQNFYNHGSPGESGALVYSANSGKAYWLRGQIYKKFTFFTNNSRMGCPIADEVNEGNGCYSMTFESGNDDGNPTVRWCGGSDPFYCDFSSDFRGMETTTNGQEGCVPIFLPPQRGAGVSCTPFSGGACGHHASICAWDLVGVDAVHAARGGRVEARIGSAGCQNGCMAPGGGLDNACCNACMNDGNHVIVHHPDGSQELYFHLASVAVANGAEIGPGAFLGNAGQSGCANGKHLHFEVRSRGARAWRGDLCNQIGRMIGG